MNGETSVLPERSDKLSVLLPSFSFTGLEFDLSSDSQQSRGPEKSSNGSSTTLTDEHLIGDKNIGIALTSSKVVPRHEIEEVAVATAPPVPVAAAATNLSATVVAVSEPQAKEVKVPSKPRSRPVSALFCHELHNVDSIQSSATALTTNSTATGRGRRRSSFFRGRAFKSFSFKPTEAKDTPKVEIGRSRSLHVPSLSHQSRPSPTLGSESILGGAAAGQSIVADPSRSSGPSSDKPTVRGTTNGQASFDVPEFLRPTSSISSISSKPTALRGSAFSNRFANGHASRRASLPPTSVPSAYKETMAKRMSLVPETLLYFRESLDIGFDFEESVLKAINNDDELDVLREESEEERDASVDDQAKPGQDSRDARSLFAENRPSSSTASHTIMDNRHHLDDDDDSRHDSALLSSRFPGMPILVEVGSPSQTSNNTASPRMSISSSNGTNGNTTHDTEATSNSATDENIKSPDDVAVAAGAQDAQDGQDAVRPAPLSSLPERDIEEAKGSTTPLPQTPVTEGPAEHLLIQSPLAVCSANSQPPERQPQVYLPMTRHNNNPFRKMRRLIASYFSNVPTGAGQAHAHAHTGRPRSAQDSNLAALNDDGASINQPESVDDASTPAVGRDATTLSGPSERVSSPPAPRPVSAVSKNQPSKPSKNDPLTPVPGKKIFNAEELFETSSQNPPFFSRSTDSKKASISDAARKSSNNIQPTTSKNSSLVSPPQTISNPPQTRPVANNVQTIQLQVSESSPAPSSPTDVVHIITPSQRIYPSGGLSTTTSVAISPNNSPAMSAALNTKTSDEVKPNDTTIPNTRRAQLAFDGSVTSQSANAHDTLNNFAPPANSKSSARTHPQRKSIGESIKFTATKLLSGGSKLLRSPTGGSTKASGSISRGTSPFGFDKKQNSRHSIITNTSVPVANDDSDGLWDPFASDDDASDSEYISAVAYARAKYNQAHNIDESELPPYGYAEWKRMRKEWTGNDGADSDIEDEELNSMLRDLEKEDRKEMGSESDYKKYQYEQQARFRSYNSCLTGVPESSYPSIYSMLIKQGRVLKKHMPLADALIVIKAGWVATGQWPPPNTN